MKKAYITHLLAIIACLSFCLTSFTRCGIYSFSGVSISPSVKTASIDYFNNMAPLVVPSLSNTFTDALQQKFIKTPRLTLISPEANAHLQISGEIRGYDISPVAITGDDFASKNRLTIRVKVIFENEIEPDQNFEKEFSAYEDFDGALSVDSVQDNLITLIVETLTENIFNATIANW